MSDDPVIFERQTEEVATCTLNRPEKRNALSIQLMQQLCGYVEEAQKDKKTRVLILRAKGPAFCAGLDLNDAMDPKLRVASAKMVKQSLVTLYQTPLVTIAMVHGAAVGGGAGLVAACDFAVADEDATIGFPEVRRGLAAAQVMSVLVRKLKRADLADLLLSGELMIAARALQMGLFSRVGNIELEAKRLTDQVLRGAPQALAKTKRILDDLYRSDLETDLDMCLLHHILTMEGAEAREGMAAFLEKRKTGWERSG